MSFIEGLIIAEASVFSGIMTIASLVLINEACTWFEMRKARKQIRKILKGKDNG